MRIFLSLLFLLIAVGTTNFCNSQNALRANHRPSNSKLDLPIEIPTTGNSWVIDDLEKNDKIIDENGIYNWADTHTRIRTYFKTDRSGELHIGLNIKSINGLSKINVTVGETTREIDISDPGKVEVGIFKISEPGYHYAELQGVEKSENYFPDIDFLLIGGPATQGKITFVKDDFYWGRRGPSVHLTYETPSDKDLLWFYNEITVPEGEDVLGSYFMANGFGEGYFGMQVNSETERRILFSVWSPYDTQDPNDIPEGYKIILLKKGEKVTTGEFGNEGSGGQSYKVFDWKAGNTYRFLLKANPVDNNSTDYTAYFYAPVENKWLLIASFRRPHTSTYLTRPHSFLENFLTETGNISRKGKYGNQWVYDTEGNWHELTKAKFTADATARKGSRLDYAGGAKDNIFFMKNCGFFNGSTPIDTSYERMANGVAPDVDLSKLK